MENLDNEKILAEAKDEASSCKDMPSLMNSKAKYLGKKGPLTSLFAQMKNIPNEQKKAFGQRINEIKEKLSIIFDEQKKLIEERKLNERLEKETIDVTLPGHSYGKGSEHPFEKVVKKIEDFFVGYGYEVKDGPEVETDYFNFECLNIPKDHPARDMQDSFFISEGMLLRSHTSPVQARVMQAKDLKLPLKVICPGKVYRRDNDATHSHEFGQVEGLVIGEDVNLGNLEKTLTDLLQYLFGPKVTARFRPSFFPFTEPSVEVDLSCFECHGKGCGLCKSSGWIEILGAGMVNPDVFRLNGIDPDKYQGFAFGVGIERVAMLLYGIDDIHRFYTDDVDFLKQFSKED